MTQKDEIIDAAVRRDRGGDRLSTPSNWSNFDEFAYAQSPDVVTSPGI